MASGPTVQGLSGRPVSFPGCTDVARASVAIGRRFYVVFALKNRGAEDWRDKQRDEDPGPANAEEGVEWPEVEGDV